MHLTYPNAEVYTCQYIYVIFTTEKIVLALYIRPAPKKSLRLTS